MITTAIIIVNLAINMANFANPLVLAYYADLDWKTKALYWGFGTLSTGFMYWLILGTTGMWNLLGWALVIINTIAAVGIAITLRLIQR